jgi:hypothetical protein
VIRLLGHNEINREAWDHCIRHAIFETLYPYSWYLDLVSPGWEALVLDNYKAVMPLTWTKKLGFSMLLQPILAQQLGIFAVSPMETGLLDEFLMGIPAKFRYIDVCLNRENREKIRQKWQVFERGNYELDLSGPEDAYSNNTRRNIQKGLSRAFECRGISVREYLYLKFHGVKGARPAVRWSYLENLFTGLKDMGKADVFGLFRGDDLQAAAILGYAESRIIYLNGCLAGEGKENRAMFVLMDKLISQSRGKSNTFDFEGSNIPGVARFYEGFGASRTVYRRIVKSPFPLVRKRK